jgi:hypothetical protein
MGSEHLQPVRSPAQASRTADPAMRRLVELRFAQICAGEPYDPDRRGYTIIYRYCRSS